MKRKPPKRRMVSRSDRAGARRRAFDDCFQAACQRRRAFVEQARQRRQCFRLSVQLAVARLRRQAHLGATRSLPATAPPRRRR